MSLTALALAVKLSMVCWVVTLLAAMLAGIETIIIAKAKLKANITRSDRVFRLVMFLIAGLECSYVLTPASLAFLSFLKHNRSNYTYHNNGNYNSDKLYVKG